MKNGLASLALLLFALLVSLGIAEIVVRNVLPVYPSIYKLNDQYLYGFQPGAWSIFAHSKENGGDKILVTINDFGYRGRDPREARGHPRIAVYGDSFIHAAFTRLEDTFAVQIEAALRTEHGVSAEVIPAGVPGYAPDQSSQRIEEEIDVIRPDLLIVALYAANDFGGLLRNKIFRLDENGELAENAFVISAESRKRFAEKRKLFDRGQLINHSMLVRVLKKVYWAWSTGADGRKKAGIVNIDEYFDEALPLRHREYDRYIIEGNNEVKIRGGSGYDADISLDPESASAVYKTALMAKVFERISQTAKRRSLPLVILVIPSPIDACEGYDYQVDSRDYPAYDRRTLTNTLVTIAAQSGIPYFDLFPVFHKSECNDYFYHHGDDHWNALGQRVAAAEFSDFLVSEGFLD